MSGLGQQRRIAGRYRLESRLGRGGMGTVWRAFDELLGRRVAVKEIHVDAGTAPHSSLREARAVARVHHPNVICVHDVVEEDGTPYIVMELVEGVSLAELLALRGPVDATEAARIGLALLGALRAAHALGVLHRDLKPANVLLEDGTGRVVLTDFGIAQLAGATTLTEAGMFVGSPEYTAPERMQGAQAGPETDLWSLGALLCAALTGQSPFHRDSLGGVLHAVVEEDVRTPAAAAPLLPVVRALLERDPERRMRAAEAERLLEAYVVTGTTPLYRPDPGHRPDADRPERPDRSERAGRAGRAGRRDRGGQRYRWNRAPRAASEPEESSPRGRQQSQDAGQEHQRSQDHPSSQEQQESQHFPPSRRPPDPERPERSGRSARSSLPWPPRRSQRQEPYGAPGSSRAHEPPDSSETYEPCESYEPYGPYGPYGPRAPYDDDAAETAAGPISDGPYASPAGPASGPYTPPAAPAPPQSSAAPTPSAPPDPTAPATPSGPSAPAGPSDPSSPSALSAPAPPQAPAPPSVPSAPADLRDPTAPTAPAPTAASSGPGPGSGSGSGPGAAAAAADAATVAAVRAATAGVTAGTTAATAAVAATAPTTRTRTQPARSPARTPVIAAVVLAAALAGAGAAALLLVREDLVNNRGGGHAVPPVTTVTASPQERPTSSPAPAPAPSPTRNPAPAPAPTRSTPVPAGYRAVVDPGGFSLIVPEGYLRSTDGKRVYYMSPDRAVRIGVRIRQPVAGGPLAAMRRSHADGPVDNPGYRAAKVTPTTYNGLPAALREFTWDGFPAAGGTQGGPRRTYDICWDEGGRTYSVWVSAPLARLDELKRHFDTVLDSFRVRQP